MSSNPDQYLKKTFKRMGSISLNKNSPTKDDISFFYGNPDIDLVKGVIYLRNEMLALCHSNKFM